MNAWLQFFITLFGWGKATAEVVEKALPSEKIQEEKFEEKKDLREQDNRQDEITDDFNFVKDDVEYDIWDYLKDVHPTMTNEERVTRHKILLGMVIEFRKGIVKRRGLKWKKYKKWLEENTEK